MALLVIVSQTYRVPSVVHVQYALAIQVTGRCGADFV